MNSTAKKEHKTLSSLLESIFGGVSECQEIDLQEAYQLGDKKVRIPAKWLPIQLSLGPSAKSLHIYPEKPLRDINSQSAPTAFQLLDPENYFSGVAGFVRLSEGGKVTLSRSDPEQKRLLNLPSDLSERHISISCKSGELIIRKHSLDSKDCICALGKDEVDKIRDSRRKTLLAIRRIFQGPVTALAAPDALDLIKRVNQILETEAYRAPDNMGRPGGVISLPKNLTPVIVGDLHTKVDNLLVVLSQNDLMNSLEAGRTCLVIIGDAVHSEEKDSLEEMESSMLIMDLVFKLKAHFPQQVFYLLGNHDSFSENVGKGGVPQGLLWKRALISARGEEYYEEMRRFYEQTALIAMSKHFISCHAGPPISKFSLNKLVNIRDHEHLAREVVTVRCKRAGRPAGYGKKEVKNLRETLEVSKGTAVIVGHTPVDEDDTIWEDIAGINNHYVVYSAANHWVGAMALIGGAMQALRYPTEPALDFLNAMTDD